MFKIDGSYLFIYLILCIYQPVHLTKLNKKKNSALWQSSDMRLPMKEKPRFDPMRYRLLGQRGHHSGKPRISLSSERNPFK